MSIVFPYLCCRNRHLSILTVQQNVEIFVCLHQVLNSESDQSMNHIFQKSLNDFIDQQLQLQLEMKSKLTTILII